ncbi:unnamed protein product, partial [Allacma fusca]
MEALLDNLPPESPSESPESTPKPSQNSPHTADADESFPNLTSILSDHQVTTPTHPQQSNQSHSLVLPLMSLNLEETPPIDRSFKIPRSNRKRRKGNKRFHFQNFPRRPNYYSSQSQPVPLMSLQIDPPQFYPSRINLIQPHHPYNRRYGPANSSGLKITSSRCDKCSSVTRKIQESAGTSEDTPVSY